MRSGIVALFPGQGSYAPGALAEVADQAAVREVLEVGDEVGGRYGIDPVSPLLTDPGSPGLDALVRSDPDRLMLAIFAASTAGHAFASAEYGMRADALLGHSFGEIAALTAAGAFTVADGAKILCLRSRALRDSPPMAGGLLAVSLSAERVEHLLAGGGFRDLELAVVNAPRQVVVSGPHDELECFARLAEVLKISVGRLRSPYPFHHRACAPAAREFANAIASVTVRPMSARVFSGGRDRFYPDGATALADLPGQLTRPVRHLGAVRRLHAQGADVFVECGAGRILTDLVRATLAQVTAVALFDRSSSPEALAAALGAPAPMTASLAPAYPETSPPRSGGAPPPKAPVPPPPAPDSPNGAATSGPSRRPALVPAPAPSGADRDRLVTELCASYAEKLGYPEEVVTEDADLEAELGVDSLKRSELLAWTAERFQITPTAEEFRPGDYATVSSIADFVLSAREAGRA